MKRILLFILGLIVIGVIIWLAICMVQMYKAKQSLYIDLPYTQEQREALTVYAESNKRTLPELAKSEWKTKVNDTIGYGNYIELNFDFLIPEDYIGACYGAFTNTVIVDSNLIGIDYAETLLHELVHLVHWITNECHTEFTAFQLAYESTDPHMQALANHLIETTLRETSQEYICTGRIIDYLTKRGVI